MFYVPQLSNDDCGFACLKMLLANLNHNKNYLFMPCDENHGLYSFKELSKIAYNNGLGLTGFKVKDKTELLNCEKFPVIVRIRVGEQSSHAVLIKKLTKKHAYVVDPHLGKYKVKLIEFFKIWDGTGLFITSFEKHTMIVEVIEPISKVKKFFTVLLQLLSGISIIVGIYFIDPNGNYIVPLVFFGMGLIYELLLRLYLYKLMNDIDKFFESRMDEINRHSYMKYYERVQEFKAHYLTKDLNVITAVLTSIFLIFVTVFNNVTNFPLIACSILCAVIKCLVIKRKDSQRSIKIEDEEILLRKEISKDSFIMKVKNLNYEAYRFSKSKLFTNYLGIVFFIISAVFVQILGNSFTLLNVLFSVCIEVFLYQNLVPIFSHEFKEQEATLVRAKLANLFFEPLDIEQEIY